MPEGVIRNLGEQPLAQLMQTHGLKPHNLVVASKVQMTHKMVTRAIKGRRLSPNVKCTVRDAFNLAASTSHSVSELFNY
ncbi:MAG: hypothetical protein O3B13_17695 [Planctomycetota bacterium]|nr:hypothetical protein [Planctomycetota bacterium]